MTGREEATSGKVGGEMWFGGEMDWGCCRGEGALVTETGEREGHEGL